MDATAIPTATPITGKQAAAILGISRSQVYRWIERGELRAEKNPEDTSRRYIRLTRSTLPPGRCLQPHCVRDAVSLGYCRTHYRYHRRHNSFPEKARRVRERTYPWLIKPGDLAEFAHRLPELRFRWRYAIPYYLTTTTVADLISFAPATVLDWCQDGFLLAHLSPHRIWQVAQFQPPTHTSRPPTRFGTQPAVLLNAAVEQAQKKGDPRIWH